MPNFSGPFDSQVTGKRIVIISYPLFENKTVSGILACSIQMSTLADNSVATTYMGRSGMAFVTDAKGTILLHPYGITTISIDFSDPHMWEAIDNSFGSGQVSLKWEGRPQYAYAMRLEHVNWYVFATFPEREVEAQAAVVAKRSLLVNSAALFFVGLVIFFIVRGIVVALEQGVHFAKSVADVNLSQTLAVHRKDELGKLADALRQMLEKLRQSIYGLEHERNKAETASAELAEYKDHLEEIVHTRRAELLLAKEEAQKAR